MKNLEFNQMENLFGGVSGTGCFFAGLFGPITVIISPVDVPRVGAYLYQCWNS